MKFSAHAVEFPELTYLNYYGGFEVIELDAHGRKRLELAFQASNNGSNSIVDFKMTIDAGYVGQTGVVPVLIDDVRGDATVSGNAITLTNGISAMKAVAVILNPPPLLLLQLEATTFPASPNGSKVRIWASWR